MRDEYNRTNDFSDVVAADRESVWHHMTQHKKYETSDPPVMVDGVGSRVWDATGREYLDATSGGVWTANLGYGRKSIADAVHAQLLKLNFFANTMGSVPGALLSRKLTELMPGMTRIYLAVSGSEANEKVYKMVRQIAHLKHGGKKNKILYRERDYHGSTIATLSSSGQPQRAAQYGPFTPGFVSVPPCLAYRDPRGANPDYGVQAAQDIEAVIQREDPDTIGAIVLEPITAGGGGIVPPEGYWETVQEICRRYEILLHIDEVVFGLGRSGKWFAYQHDNIQPDFVTMAKGVAAGYAPIACIATTERVFDLFKSTPNDVMSFYRDITTFGGCTGGPAAALETIRIIEEENILENVTTVGAYLQEQTRNLMDRHQVIGDVRGKGLFVALELVEDRGTKEPVHENRIQEVAKACLNQGVLVGMTIRSFERFNNVILLSPMLNTTREEIDSILRALDTALTTVFHA